MLRRSSVLSASVSVGLAIALLAQPAAAQTAPQVQATPTPAPASSALVVSPDNAPVISPAPSTAVSVSNDVVTVTNLTLNPTDPAALTSQPASAPPISVTRCGGPTHIFQSCLINVPGGPDNQTVLEQEAVAAVLEQHALPASDATRVMRSARDSVRAALIKKVDAAFRKSKDTRSAAEQAAVDAFTRLVRQKHVQAAMIAQNEYARWAYYPCGYTPPAGFSYNAGIACASSQSRIVTPPSPGLQAFEAYGGAGAYQTSQIDAATAHLYGATSSAAILGYGYAVAVASSGAAVAISTVVPETVFAAILHRGLHRRGHPRPTPGCPGGGPGLRHRPVPHQHRRQHARGGRPGPVRSVHAEHPARVRLD